MAYNTGTDPTLAEAITGKFIPEIFSQTVIQAVQSNLVVVDSVWHEFQDDLAFGYKVNIPVTASVAATEVTPGTEPTPDDAIGSPKSLTVDKWYQCTLEYSEMMDIQNRPDYLDAAANQAAYAVTAKMDTDLGGLFSTLANSVVQGSDGQILTDDIILALMQYLDEGDVPEGDRVIICDPSSKVDLLKIDKFVRNDYVREPVVPTGKFGMIYNMMVRITNNLTVASTGNYGVMMHRHALAFVAQRLPRARRIPKPWEFVVKYTVDAIYGIAEVRDTFGKSFYTRSS